MNKYQMIFDPADTSGTDSVGAYVRAGTDGDLIESTIVNSKESLNVASAMFSGTGTAITDTAGSLDVNITNSGDIDVQLDVDKLHDAAAGAGGENGLNILGVRQDTLSADTTTDGDYARFKMTSAGRLYVDADISGSTGTLDTKEAPTTAAANASTTIDTTAGGVALPASALTNRRIMYIANMGNKDVFAGVGTVTAANGYPIPKRTSIGPIEVGDGVALKAIAEAGGSEDVRTLELAK